MLGLMQSQPLLISSLITFAERHHGDGVRGPWVVREYYKGEGGDPLLQFYEGRIAKWQIPDDVIFSDAIPLGATGKMLKARLREQLAGHELPILQAAGA